MIQIMTMAVVTAIATILGLRRGTQVMDENKGLTLDKAHLHLPEVVWFLPICMLFTATTVFVFSRPDALWLLPAVIDPWALPILFTFSVGFMCYILSTSLRIAYRSGHAEKHKLAVASGILIVGLTLMYGRQSMPMHASLQDKRKSDNAILQTSLFSCAPASMANILTLRGISTTEREMARLAGTTRLGTSPGAIIGGFRKKGIKAHKAILSVERLSALASPAILLIDLPGLGPMSHAVVIERFENDTAHLIDPIWGRIQLSAQELAGMWRGYAICIAPGE